MSVERYQVWQLDCSDCGTVISYGEDESSCPDACEDCGAPVDVDHSDNEEREFEGFRRIATVLATGGYSVLERADPQPCPWCGGVVDHDEAGKPCSTCLAEAEY